MFLKGIDVADKRHYLAGFGVYYLRKWLERRDSSTFGTKSELIDRILVLKGQV